jgi:hypothetical protein
MSTSAYTSFVSVDFTHDYWGTQPFRGLRATPLHTETGMLFRPRPGGFTLYFDANFCGRPRTREDVLKTTVRSMFRLELTDPYFYNYTDLPLQLFCFWNEPGTSTLHQEPSDGTAPFFGLLELTLDADLQNSYTFRFATLSTHWRYILVGDSLTRLENPSVVDPQTKEAFEGPLTVTLKDNRPAIAFTSKTPIALADPVTRRFQLLEQDKVVLNVLPGPDVRYISSAIAGVSTASEILLY